MFIPSYISEFRGTIDNTIAGAKNVNFRFFIRPKSRIPEGSYLVMQIPPEFVPYDIEEQKIRCANILLNEPENGFTAT